MSTSETVEFEVGPCPCGNGKIMKHVTTQDSPWSSADISLDIACGNCRAEWRIENSSLVKKSTETAFQMAQAGERPKYDALKHISIRLTDAYFVKFSAKTKKAEHAEMVRLGIYKGSYRDFLKARAKGKSLAAVCHALGNKKWLADLAAEAGVSEEFGRALAEFEVAQKRTSDAYGLIVRRPIPNSRSIWP
jgi:hypothetical protein